MSAGGAATATDTGPGGAAGPSDGATGGDVETAGGGGAGVMALSDCRNVGGIATKCWEGALFGALAGAPAGTSGVC